MWILHKKGHKFSPRLFIFFLLMICSLLYVCPLRAFGEEASPTPEASPSSGDIPQPSGEFYFNDTANLLTEATKSAILTKNGELYEKYGAQIVVYTTAALPYESFAQRVEYLRRLMDSWQVGGESGRGLLVAVSVADQDYLAVAGTGLQGEFTTQALKDLLSAQLEPDFSAGAYDAGLSKFFTAAAGKAETYLASGAVQTNPNGAASQGTPARSGGKKKQGPNILLWVCVGAAGVAVVSLAVFVLAGRASWNHRNRRTVHRRSSLLYPSRTTIMHLDARPTVQVKHSQRSSQNSYRTQKQSRSRSNIDWRQ